jgi:hypothetical protein
MEISMLAERGAGDAETFGIQTWGLQDVLNRR